jgi:hypothetical protein
MHYCSEYSGNSNRVYHKIPNWLTDLVEFAHRAESNDQQKHPQERGKGRPQHRPFDCIHDQTPSSHHIVASGNTPHKYKTGPVIKLSKRRLPKQEQGKGKNLA